MGVQYYLGQEFVSITIAPRVAIHSYYCQEVGSHCIVSYVVGPGLVWTVYVQFMCDNMAVVVCVNLGSLKDSLVTHFLQASTKFCFEVQAAHIPGQLNRAADALSRGNRSLSYTQAKPVETQIPSEWVDTLLHGTEVQLDLVRLDSVA